MNDAATGDADLVDTTGAIDIAINAITGPQDATIPATRNKAALQVERARVIAARATGATAALAAN